MKKEDIIISIDFEQDMAVYRLGEEIIEDVFSRELAKEIWKADVRIFEVRKEIEDRFIAECDRDLIFRLFKEQSEADIYGYSTVK